ncbi:MAG: hypothetical protein KGL59_00230 [Acidobacteriota bacterium]|nr:hypothetical protein [Acidobacteriota bacterium]
MRPRTLTAIVLLVIATILLCPISEMFDRWDHTAKTGKDTESSLMLVAECAGAAIAVIHSAAAFLPAFVIARLPVVFRSPAPRFRFAAAETFRFPESPPSLPLRI